jgi:hypothetical protein
VKDGTGDEEAGVQMGFDDGDYGLRLDNKFGYQSYTIPRGVVHKTSAPGRTVILMVEVASVAPTGDSTG